MLGLGCTQAAKALKSLGLQYKAVRSLQQLLHPNEAYLQARAMLLRPSVLQETNLMTTLRSLKRHYPLIDIILWAPQAPNAQVRLALKAGAKDVELSERPEELAETVFQVIEEQQLLPRVQELQEAPPKRTEFEDLRSRSRKMWDLFEFAMRIAPTTTSVLILGETGTGKELFARAIHQRSGRKGNFVAVNCGAIPEHLIDSELFGHVKGTFTGAIQNKQGLFRYAEKGTLFLDELGNIPLDVQFRLLRVLQEGSIRPVGGHEEIPVDVRVLAATNAPLEELVETGQFREDLFYRLDVLRIEIPPLRSRPEDIIFLLSLFTRELAEQYQLERPELDEGFLDGLVSYDWPGNVRELENFAERLVLTRAKKRVGAKHFQQLIRSNKKPSSPTTTDSSPNASRPQENVLFIDTSQSLADNVQPVVSRLERAYLQACLQENAGRIGDTAAQAGINRRTLLRKLKQYEIDKRQFRKQSG